MLLEIPILEDLSLTDRIFGTLEQMFERVVMG